MKMNSFHVITAFPDLIESYFQEGVLSKACSKNLLNVRTVNLRDYANNKYKSIDDTPFGGGDGMLINADILQKALESVPNYQDKKIVYLSPQGKVWNSEKAKEWATVNEDVVLVCGRYAGIDQRFINQYVEEEISIGPYVLSGGELAALVVIESVARFIPGVLGDQNSAETDSFQRNLLEAPQFTKPQIWNNQPVPEVLTSGHHAKIADWKECVAVLVTLKKQPNLLKNVDIPWDRIKNFYKNLSAADIKVLDLEGLKFYD